jgi:AbrB family looped-hinge helix DNA binding protein
MSAVTISTKYQIVIPKEVREMFDLKPGQKIEVLAYNGQIHLIPFRSLEAMEGIFPGLDTTVEREPDREF